MMRRIGSLRAALGVGLALCSTGCWSFMRGSPDLPAPGAHAPLASDVILRVNEAGIAWGNGELGAEIQRQLIAARLFEHVHYPVEPVNPPELVIEVQPLGTLREPVVWNAVATYATAYLLLAPLPVMPFFGDFGVGCDVRVLRGTQVVAAFRVETESTLVRAMLASPTGALAKARSRVFHDAAQRIVANVAVARLARAEPPDS